MKVIGCLSCSCVVMLTSLFSPGASLANDSTSHPTSTGIEFIKNDDVSIESETLLLSERSVAVEYDFYNHSSKEVSVKMAFPLPELNTGFDFGGKPSTWNFLVFVNGKKNRDVRIQWRALVNGADKALILQKVGINIENPRLNDISYQNKNLNYSTAACLNYNLNKEDQELLINEGLAYKNDELEDCIMPMWIAQATYLWEAKFRPRKITKVKHTYAQWPGSWICHPKENEADAYDCWEGTKELQKVRKMFGGVSIDTFFYEYVIHTGGNWKGPIKKFKFRAQGPRGSFAWVKAPFPIKRKSNNTLIADLDNYKPLPRAEVEQKRRSKSLIEMDDSVVFFNYVKKHKNSN